MLTIPLIFTTVILFVGRFNLPTVIFCISWLICIVPIASGAISYAYYSSFDIFFELSLSCFLGCFLLGIFAHKKLVKKSSIPPNQSVQIEISSISAWLTFAWLCGVVGTVMIFLDFIQRGAQLDDLAMLRELYVGKKTSLFAQIGSVLTWGCLYSFAFALMYQNRLTMRRFIFYILPSLGYFFVAIFSAGRQATMQILIFALLILLIKKINLNKDNKKTKENLGYLFPILVSVGMIFYMGYVAGARNDGVISEDKAEVLARLFDFELSPLIQLVLEDAPSGLRNTLIEGLVYFTSPLALFYKFFEADEIKLTYGALSLPFIFRQLEPITGISVLGALHDKISLMTSMDVIGVGWTTAISGYIQDFGIFITCVFLFFQGFYTNWAWCRIQRSLDFHHIIIILILLMSIIYMPLLSLFSDTNIFILWIYCLLAVAFGKKNKYLYK